MSRVAILALMASLLIGCASGHSYGPAPALASHPANTAPVAPLDPTAIGRASGADATTMPDGVVRLGFPRRDVAVAVDGVSLRPPAGAAGVLFHALLGQGSCGGPRARLPLGPRRAAVHLGV